MPGIRRNIQGIERLPANAFQNPQCSDRASMLSFSRQDSGCNIQIGFILDKRSGTQIGTDSHILKDSSQDEEFPDTPETETESVQINCRFLNRSRTKSLAQVDDVLGLRRRAVQPRQRLPRIARSWEQHGLP